jgi:excisionase family DNA binding protein
MDQVTITTLTREELQQSLREVLMELLPLTVKKQDDRLNPEKDQVLNTTQAAKFLKISRMTLHRRMAEGSVPHRRLGRRIMFSKLELLSWLRGQGEFRYEQKGGVDE